jgi:hypothetical protein
VLGSGNGCVRGRVEGARKLVDRAEWVISMREEGVVDNEKETEGGMNESREDNANRHSNKGPTHSRISLQQDGHDKAVLGEVLQHTMLLVQAIWLTCYHMTSPYQIQRLHDLLREYLHDLPQIYCKIKPITTKFKPSTNQYMSLHLAEFLRLFRPVHSWWTYPFERLIGRLQHLPSNHKFGELNTSVDTLN